LNFGDGFSWCLGTEPGQQPSIRKHEGLNIGRRYSSRFIAADEHIPGRETAFRRGEPCTEPGFVFTGDELHDHRAHGLKNAKRRRITQRLQIIDTDQPTALKQTRRSGGFRRPGTDGAEKNQLGSAATKFRIIRFHPQMITGLDAAGQFDG